MAMPSLQDDPERQLYDAVKAKYGTLLADFKEDERFILGNYGKDVLPKEWEDQGMTEPIRFPTITDAIDTHVDHILTTPDITVPIRPTETKQDHERDLAEDKRWFLEMFWSHVFQNQGDPLGRLRKSIIKGKGVLKLEIDWQNLPKLPDDPSKKQKAKYRRDLIKAGKSRFLWKVTLIPKGTVFEDLATPWDPGFVFEAFQITVIEAIRRFPDLKGDLGERDPLETVEYIEYWSKPHGTDPGKYIQWIDAGQNTGTRIEKVNPYSWKTDLSTTEVPDYDGYIPYVIGDPGWGDVDAEAKPFDRYVSLSRYMRSPVEEETRLATVAAMALRMSVFKVLKTVNMPDVADGTKVLEVGPGKVWDLTEDQQADYVEYGEPIPLSLMQSLSKLQQVNDRHSRFDSMSGGPMRGVDTAQEADQNSRNASTKLSGPISAMRRMVQTINAWVLQDIPFVLEAPITMFGATEGSPSSVELFPRDLKRGPFITNVQLATSDEADQLRRDARLWIDAANSSPISWKTALRNAGVSNPAEEIKERRLEDLMSSEPVTQTLLQVILAAQESDEATNALVALVQGMMTGGGQGEGSDSDRSANLTAETSPDPVEALRESSRNAAIQNNPERSFQ